MGPIDARRRLRVSGYVLDTTLIIDHVNGYPPGVDLMRSLFEKSAELFTGEVVTCEALSRGNEEQLGGGPEPARGARVRCPLSRRSPLGGRSAARKDRIG